jgi:hypothetical protein
MTRSRCIAAAALFLASCASHQSAQQDFEVTSRNFDVSPMVGEWKGEFHNVELGRQGTIAFTLASREEKAVGEIVLMPTNAAGDTASTTSQSADARRKGQVLQISFIRLEGNIVVGRIEPYANQSCNCRTATTFRGVLQGPVIEGTYIVLGADDPSVRYTGNWKVTRVRRL